MGLSPVVMHARMDLLEQAGYSTFPDTWEKFIEASLKINKPPFYAYGMALGTSPGYSDSTERHHGAACGRTAASSSTRTTGRPSTRPAP